LTVAFNVVGFPDMNGCSANESLQMRLRTGRRLGFAEYGDPGGIPFFYFHGWPSSRLEGRAAAGIAARLGVRLIAPERPGCGLSEFQPHRTLRSWPADVSELADHLGLDNFGVLGV
jgi:pimeloyl-ACP methyl ester carboxylesterase